MPGKEPADRLTAYGVSSRYPDDWREIDDNEMKENITSTEAFRAVLLPQLEAYSPYSDCHK